VTNTNEPKNDRPGELRTRRRLDKLAALYAFVSPAFNEKLQLTHILKLQALNLELRSSTTLSPTEVLSAWKTLCPITVPKSSTFYKIASGEIDEMDGEAMYALDYMQWDKPQSVGPGMSAFWLDRLFYPKIFKCTNVDSDTALVEFNECDLSYIAPDSLARSCHNCDNLRDMPEWDKKTGWFGQPTRAILNLPPDSKLPCNISHLTMSVWRTYYSIHPDQRTLYPINCPQFISKY
jgi:hypothetical protein